MQKKITASIIAGKLTLSTQAAYTAGLGKADETDSGQVSTLTLDEIGAPFNIITAPQSTLCPDSGSKQSGVIYANLAAKLKIDFIVTGIRNDMPVQVYLLHSKSAGKPEIWPAFSAGQGQLELGVEGFSILAGMVISPAVDMGPFPETALGSYQHQQESLVFPVRLSNLENLGEDGETLYFQVVAIPNAADGSFLFDQAQASEVDAFVIDRSSTSNQELDKCLNPAASDDSGSKDEGSSTGDDGGSSSGNDNGSKDEPGTEPSGSDAGGK